MTRIKICGITNYDDALLAVKYGATDLGFNFYEKSPRYVTPETARAIINSLPATVGKIGVFVNENVETIARIAREAGLSAVQLHGDEDASFVNDARIKTKVEIIKALRVGPDFDPHEVSSYGADAILLDSYSEKERGGTGETFDWTMTKEAAATGVPIYLAGGLTAENVAEAITQFRPFAVDACSRLESSPGKKDLKKLKSFIAAVKETI